jgi:hypothetical protein
MLAAPCSGPVDYARRLHGGKWHLLRWMPRTAHRPGKSEYSVFGSCWAAGGFKNSRETIMLFARWPGRPSYYSACSHSSGASNARVSMVAVDPSSSKPLQHPNRLSSSSQRNERRAAVASMPIQNLAHSYVEIHDARAST